MDAATCKECLPWREALILFADLPVSGKGIFDELKGKKLGADSNSQAQYCWGSAAPEAPAGG